MNFRRKKTRLYGLRIKASADFLQIIIFGQLLAQQATKTKWNKSNIEKDLVRRVTMDIIEIVATIMEQTMKKIFRKTLHCTSPIYNLRSQHSHLFILFSSIPMFFLNLSQIFCSASNFNPTIFICRQPMRN